MSDAPILQTRGVVKDFGGVRAVNRCSLSVSRGTVTGLIGPNGAGKTTLFNLISGAMPPTGGEINFDGRRIDGMRMHETFALGLTRTFQIAREMKRMTVLENLTLVPPGQIGERLWAAWFAPKRVAREERQVEARAMEILEFVSLARLANEYAGNLSTGQKKLLELARTLMREPAMVLLDEPAAGVNRTLLARLADSIRRASAEMGVTFLLIEHDVDLVMRLCDPVIVMANGAVIAEGAPNEVRANPLVLEAYLGDG